jgi:cellulose biosynthesis protein BcsQ
MGRQLSAEIDSGFERKMIVENALVAAAKSVIEEPLSERDRASLEEMINLFDSILQGEQQLRSPSLSAISIDVTRVANRIGNIYKTRFKFSKFITFVTDLKKTTSDILENRKITKENRREFEEFLDLLSESEGKEIERLQSLPLGSFSVA